MSNKAALVLHPFPSAVYLGSLLFSSVPFSFHLVPFIHHLIPFPLCFTMFFTCSFRMSFIFSMFSLFFLLLLLHPRLACSFPSTHISPGISEGLQLASSHPGASTISRG